MGIVNKGFYNLFRGFLMNYFTGGLGNVVAFDDKLICYVSGKYNTGEIKCLGIGRENGSFASNYNLDKKICYVFKDINFYDVRIIGHHNCELYFSDCNFNGSLNIMGAVVSFDNCFFDVCNTCIDSTSLLVNDSLFKVHDEALVKLNSEGCCEISDSNFLGDRGSFSIVSDDVFLVKCSMSFSDVTLKGHNVSSLDSFIKCDTFNVVADNFDYDLVLADKVLYNGKAMKLVKKSY